jgi:hypothetical protein
MSWVEVCMLYTETASKIGFRLRRLAIASESLPASLNLHKLSCFGTGKPGSDSRRLLAEFPIFEAVSVYFKSDVVFYDEKNRVIFLNL